jgi:hypothetical protein
MAGDASCLAVAKFLCQLHNGYTELTKGSSEVAGAVPCFDHWDMLALVQKSSKDSPAEFREAIQLAWAAGLPEKAREVAETLNHQAYSVLVYLDSQSNGRAAHSAQSYDRWRTVPLRDLHHWVDARVLRAEAPLWASFRYVQPRVTPQLTRRKSHADTSGRVRKKNRPPDKLQSWYVDLALVHEKRCASTVLCASAIECTQIVTRVEEDRHKIHHTINGIIQEHRHVVSDMEQQSKSPIERLETFFQCSVSHSDEVMAIAEHAVYQHKATQALGRWLDASLDISVGVNMRLLETIGVAVASVLGRMATIGDTGSHVVVARIAAAHTECAVLLKTLPLARNTTVEELLVAVVSALDDAIAAARCVDAVMLELSEPATGFADLWTAVQDEIGYTCERLHTVDIHAKGLAATIQSVRYRPPPALQFCSHTSQLLHLEPDVVQGLYVFRQVVIDDCRSHGLLQDKAECSSIKDTFWLYVTATDADLPTPCPATILNDYVSALLSLTLFMAPVQSPVEALTVCRRLTP